MTSKTCKVLKTGHVCDVKLYITEDYVLIEKKISKQIKNLDQNEKSGFGLPPDSSAFGGKPNALLALFQEFFARTH